MCLVGQSVGGMTVCCCYDNAVVVAILRSGTSKLPRAMHLMRCLFFFFVAYYQIYLDPIHLLGRCNAADRLLRNNLPVFYSWCQQLIARQHHSQKDLRRLDDRAAFYFSEGSATSTIRTSQSGQGRFLKY